MINKIYKRIHNKYSTIFKFIFFLRYLFGIFLISVVLFLLIPHFFDLKKKDQIIKEYLFKNYDLKLTKYESIRYNSFPTPNLEILNASTINSNSIKFDTKNLKIYPRLISIYNFENFKVKKIILNKNKISLKVNELTFLSKYIYKLKNKISFYNLELKIFRKNESLLNLDRISLSNYGHNKNIIKGQVFNKQFKISINDSFEEVNLKLLNTGIDIDFKELKNLNIMIINLKFIKLILETNIYLLITKVKLYTILFLA